MTGSIFYDFLALFIDSLLCDYVDWAYFGPRDLLYLIFQDWY